MLQGEHDIATAPDLAALLAEVIDPDGADLVLDLRGVEFIDAATIGVLVRADMLLRARSRALLLRCPSACARRLLDLCGLLDLVESDDEG